MEAVAFDPHLTRCCAAVHFASAAPWALLSTQTGFAFLSGTVLGTRCNRLCEFVVEYHLLQLGFVP